MKKIIKKMFTVLIIIALVIGIALGVYILTGLDNSLTLREYSFKTDKVTNPIKIAFVSDHHGSEFGENNSELMDMINASDPDVVLLGGDMFDEPEFVDIEKDLISQLTEKYDVYGVLGNHAYKMDEYTADDLRKIYAELGVTLLTEDCKVLMLNGEKINICGMDVYPENEGFDGRIDKTLADTDKDAYTVMLYHRPDKWEEFKGKGIDLMLSGHTHGGQWIVPGVFNGILAPNQGFFPKYAGGLYEFDDGMNLIVSRGLATKNTIVPRVYNPPELVVIKIESDR
ncbi:MAG: metallophosphoesterase [Clostridia bacterium]|nr:metallophosphoesterase [Clostridia bacterium]